MKALRTPEERFENLKDYPFGPNHVDIDAGDGTSLRMHYLDEGPADGEIALCLHGQPTWSYLYRKMIPLLTGAGLRVIAPDLIGFGKSDKPAARADYTYANHVHWMNSFIRSLDLNGMTLVGQDWGGLIGLRVLVENLDRFARVVVANTGLPDARDIPDEMTPTLRKLLEETPALPPAEMAMKLFGGGNDRPAFMYWVRYCDAYPEFDPSEIVSLSLQSCDAEERRAYAAPFPSEEYVQGARQFPSLVPIIPDNPAIPANRAAWETLQSFEKPLITAFSDNDPVTAGGHLRFQEEVPGAKGQKHTTIKGAGHFLQDDAPEALASVIVDFVQGNPA